MLTKNKRFLVMLVSALSLLLIPLVAMQFTHEVDWSPFDFLVMGILLAATSLLIETILRFVKKTPYRIVLSLGILLIFLLIWAELAVGIFGTPFAGN